ncbi:putrescine hydroxycinnamoyltransferase 1-like [Triticum dicoccoides]|uniref:putrescine hydroxycinnamoyltransferase 1-like n=1 Tax=Triticum dicoccoides TaxID=85692 RepID=UPI001890CECD|nr:putrescine hydroxycinnamoyltransferase 1-like [Triticum dicoccoides]
MVEEVKVVECCMVTPSEETPRCRLWLSPLDLMMVNRGHTPIVYFYRSASVSDDGFFEVARLKAAMAKALVPFCPLAGRLGVDGDGRPEIDCTGQGARFMVARSELAAADFSARQPSPEPRRLFVPRDIDDVILAVQVTFFKCGGVALGTALHHVAIDALSAFHFFQTWSAFSRDEAGDGAGAAATALELPCHDRTLLRARSPPRVVNPDALSVFLPLKNDPNIPVPEPSGPAVNEIFVLSNDQVTALKRACGGASTFCVLFAHVWRCLCAARRLPTDAETRFSFPANFRRSLRPSLPARYFGNGIIMVGTACKVRDVVATDGSKDQAPLASVAGRIRDVVRGLDDELVRSSIDYLETAPTMPAACSMPATELTKHWIIKNDDLKDKELQELGSETFGKMMDSDASSGEEYGPMGLDQRIQDEFFNSSDSNEEVDMIMLMSMQEEMDREWRHTTTTSSSQGIAAANSVKQKCTAALRMLALGTIADVTGEMVRMRESMCLKTTVKFACAVLEVFGPEYLREPNVEDTEKLLAIGEAMGFPEMLGSINCMHWQWKNCPKGLRGMYQGHTREATIILKVAASQDLWIWHAFFEMPGSHIDINVLQRSPVFRRLCNGESTSCNYTVNGRDYNMGYYLANGIYPQ